MEGFKEFDTVMVSGVATSPQLELKDAVLMISTISEDHIKFWAFDETMPEKIWIPKSAIQKITLINSGELN